MKLYVVGLAFTTDAKSVLLIRKTKPRWQAGRFNGVGGKVEPGETFPAAMEREFREETGLTIPEADWREVLVYEGPDYLIRFYTTVSDSIRDAQATTEEIPLLVPVKNIEEFHVINNLRWIIPLCREQHIELPLTVREPASPRRDAPTVPTSSVG